MFDQLENLRIAVPESRQLDVLKNLFEKRGAIVTACPLVAIYDSPEEKAMQTWLERFIQQPPEIFIILTGEGIYRLTGFAERFAMRKAWQQALTKTYKLARGPKPNRALKGLDLTADELGVAPTTDGIIQSLEKHDLTNKRIAVQLYGDNPNDKLQHYLQNRACDYSTVSPYIYASDSETELVKQLILDMANGHLDMICFTSQPQYKRLLSVAKKENIEEALHSGLSRIKIAAVGPVVTEQIENAGYQVAIMPEQQYFMKPMVQAINDERQG